LIKVFSNQYPAFHPVHRWIFSLPPSADSNNKEQQCRQRSAPNVNVGGKKAATVRLWVQLQVQRETSGNNCKQQKAFCAVIILMKVLAVIALCAGLSRLSFSVQPASWRVEIGAATEAANAHVSD